MIPHVYNIKLPPTEPHLLNQHEAYFLLQEEEKETRIRFHEYSEIYKRKGLYEQLYYDRLKCGSPAKVCEILGNVLKENHVETGELRVLDVGAGNGMMGDILAKQGVARIVGIDILPEARAACERDRPGIYDAYYVDDLTALPRERFEELKSWHLDCVTTVSALGFDDIPPLAFATAYNLIREGGWAAFNIKETFLNATDSSGFSQLVKNMLLSDVLEVHHLERYRHRMSIDGRPLYYYVIVGKKERDIPMESIPC